ncbi:MAG: hypothetical protein PHG66_04820 [Candidatus Colwellbacteria bacterium]|nr:hypothetical protein [Candidatus Colwellbacteria bacterium]
MINKILLLSLGVVIFILGMVLLTNQTPKITNRDRLIKQLVRQTARWSVASDQDESPLISLLHANYGVAYASIMRDIATDEEIKSIAGIDIIDFQRKISDIQDKATRKVADICPLFVGNMDLQLLVIAGDKS